ncbi:SDR family oxidoreductase [Nannocystis punicea]|uniref:SDR family NAD(P)-dependent oxidoreductase n=1 Tax=Nannocystis punicea TaxID=2995304 RepID=A0ABY7HCP2_9BACT|nr:SDR family oxidoreductase [Nannocystis poenicansa]WAS97034.1 SDR family NAD(P)-dependent oxidoreductase [Nannocystis poenicansa]
MTTNLDFADTAALVTGASRGLGLALARELGRRGARVALVAREAAALAAAVASLRAEGLVAEAIVGDVGDKQAIHPIAHQAAALLGPVDLLIHNASTLGPTPLRLLLDTECEDFERALQVNLLGPFRLSKVIAGAMALRGRGTIVHVSSDAAVEAYPRWGAYGASKAALDHLSRTWAAELEGTGVRVLAVDPGEMDTQMHADAIPEADRASLADPADVARAIAAMVLDPAARSGDRVRAEAWKEGRR